MQAGSSSLAAASALLKRGGEGPAGSGDGRGRRDEAAFAAAVVVVRDGHRVEREQQRRQRALKDRAALRGHPHERDGGVDRGEEHARGGRG